MSRFADHTHQGDTGPGNFLYGDGRVKAILDFELAHWGDPMDDIAWLSWRHPHMPWDESELQVADVAPDGTISNARRAAGGPRLTW